MNKDNKPWVRIHDGWGDPEGHISGNREGLKELKKKIDQALNHEVGLMEDFDCDFNSVALRETKENKVEQNSTKDRVMQFGCLAIIVIVLLSCGIGICKVIEILRG